MDTQIILSWHHPALLPRPQQVGQPMVVGTEWGRVRALRGTGGRTVDEVLPGQPAEIAGLKALPQAGDQLLVSPLAVCRHWHWSVPWLVLALQKLYELS